MVRKLVTMVALVCGALIVTGDASRADVVGGDVATVSVGDVLSCLPIAVFDSASASCSS